MSITRVGATKKFADNWTSIFGGGKVAASSTKSAAKKGPASKNAVTAAKKSAKKKGTKTSTKKVAKKSAARGKKKGR